MGASRRGVSWGWSKGSPSLSEAAAWLVWFITMSTFADQVVITFLAGRPLSSTTSIAVTLGNPAYSTRWSGRGSGAVGGGTGFSQAIGPRPGGSAGIAQ